MDKNGNKMKKVVLTIAIVLVMAMGASAQVFMLDANNEREGTDPNSLPFIPGHGGDWDQGYSPLGGGAALLIGFGAAYMLAKKKKK